MLFSSITFLFLFLPIMLAVYYIAPPQWKNLLLLAGSLIFYAWGEPVYIILMILSILLNYFCGMDIENKSENEAFFSFILLITFRRVNSSRSFSSSALVIE